MDTTGYYPLLIPVKQTTTDRSIIDYLESAEPILTFLNQFGDDVHAEYQQEMLNKTDRNSLRPSSVALMKTSILTATFSLLGSVSKTNFSPLQFQHHRYMMENGTWSSLLQSMQAMQPDLEVGTQIYRSYPCPMRIKVIFFSLTYHKYCVIPTYRVLLAWSTCNQL